MRLKISNLPGPGAQVTMPTPTHLSLNVPRGGRKGTLGNVVPKVGQPANPPDRFFTMCAGGGQIIKPTTWLFQQPPIGRMCYLLLYWTFKHTFEKFAAVTLNNRGRLSIAKEISNNEFLTIEEKTSPERATTTVSTAALIKRPPSPVIKPRNGCLTEH